MIEPLAVAPEAPARLRETKHHGTALFPFNIYPCTIPKDFLSVPLHWQDSMELVFVKKGAGLAQAGLETMPAAAGDIFLFPPGVLHGLRQAPGRVMEYENIIFSMDFLAGAVDDICTQQYLRPLQAGRLGLPDRISPDDDGYGELSGCLRYAEGLCERRPIGYELGVKAAFLRFLCELLSARQLPPPRTDTPDTRRLKTALELVETSYASALTVAEAAERCGCSASHFMRWFKRMTGTGFAAFLNDRRLAAAAEELRQTDDTVLNIAGRVGFDNLSNFNRQFRARYGVTPHVYRRAV